MFFYKNIYLPFHSGSKKIHLICDLKKIKNVWTDSVK